ncbi:carbohydrate ABC transporter substrate-binding protein, CUT1 family [Faunimonas pinastri]|uniref:Carbohydrate ABC transporter substrate-binding protein, CUT1 family n=1 Tax=Faunimonas pinastri TaxID=1855383 RepID=A0A1H9EAU5_9HYPH|nr:extracellular solute-binding protein [Faunimonas pinastri]SEQ22785.1 carbohydrate ABC transporter substrate-binding protein, CUT1 family [Faunimonas pinastri]
MSFELNRRRFLSGVAAASALTVGSVPARAQTKRSLLFWHFYTQPARANYLRKMADLYQAANPGLTITIESMPTPSVVNRLAAAKAGGAMPDLVIHSSDTAIPLFASGDLLPADDLVKDLGGPSFFAPTLLDRMSSYDGHFLSLPHYCAARVLVYRKDRLAAAGLQPPVTWDDALKAAVATTSAPDHYGWSYQLSRSDNGGCSVLYPLSLTAGGGFLSSKGDVHFDSDPVREATEFMVEVIRKAGGPGVFNYSVNENFNLVNSGKTSMTLDTASLVAVAANDAPQVAEQLDAIEIPRKDKTATILQCAALMVLKGKNKNPEDAGGFAKFLLQPDRHLEFLHTIPLFMFPTTVATSGDVFFSNPVISRFRHVADVSVEALKHATLFCSDDGGINPFSSPVLSSRIVEDMLARIVLNNTPVKDAIGGAQQQMADLTGMLKRRLRR